MDVSDRRLQVQLTQQAKIPSNFIIQGIFAFAGFIGRLRPCRYFNCRQGLNSILHSQGDLL